MHRTVRTRCPSWKAVLQNGVQTLHSFCWPGTAGSLRAETRLEGGGVIPKHPHFLRGREYVGESHGGSACMSQESQVEVQQSQDEVRGASKSEAGGVQNIHTSCRKREHGGESQGGRASIRPGAALLRAGATPRARESSPRCGRGPGARSGPAWAIARGPGRASVRGAPAGRGPAR